jgi:hypothetical protein
MHAYQDLARSWCRHRDGLQAERLSRLMKQHDAHLLTIAGFPAWTETLVLL